MSPFFDLIRCLGLCFTILLSTLPSASAQFARPKSFAELAVRLGNITGKSASADEFRANAELVIVVPRQPQEPTSYHVIAFTVSVVHHGRVEELVAIPANIQIRDTVEVTDPVTGITTIQITDKITTERDYVVRGNRLLPEQAARLQGLQPGDKVFFENIRVAGSDNSIRNFGTLQLLVK